MEFPFKRKKEKDPYVFRELYMKEELALQLDAIAQENESSFNSVVIGMLEYCLETLESPIGPETVLEDEA